MLQDLDQVRITLAVDCYRSCTDLISMAADASPTLSDWQILDAELNITCADGFYLSNSSVCRPICSSWVESSEDHASQNIRIACIIIGLISSVIFITIALTIYRSELYVSTHLDKNYITWLLFTYKCRLIVPKSFVFFVCITVAFVCKLAKLLMILYTILTT